VRAGARPEEPPSAPRILIVEDEETLTLLLRYNLEAAGYAVESVARGDEAELRIAEEPPDLVLLDWMLPGVSGVELCRRIRARKDTQRLPIIMLTARGEEADRVRGLSTGADDYVVKPFSYAELRLRIAAVLRRARTRVQLGTIRVGSLELDPAGRAASVRGRRLDLSAKEFALLRMLASAPTRVFTKDELLRDVWGFRAAGSTRTLDSHACRLRQKLREDGDEFVVNVWGVGYRLVDGPYAPR
jgi:two-component system, OmpR family, phosphate regulon response regulator PhoB